MRSESAIVSIPGTRNGVSGLVERCWVVPDLTFQGGLDENADQPIVHLPEANPVLGVISLQGCHIHDGAEVDEAPTTCQLGHLARARESGHVGGIAALNSCRKYGTEITGSFVLNADTRAILERFHHGKEAVLLVAAPGCQHVHGAADARRIRSAGLLLSALATG